MGRAIRDRGLVVAILLIALLGAAVEYLYLPLRSSRSHFTDGERHIEFPADDRIIEWSAPEPLLGEAATPDIESGVSVDAAAAAVVYAIGAPRENVDLWIAERRADGRGWNRRRLDELSSDRDDVAPHLSADGRRIVFASDRDGGMGGFDLWLAERVGPRFGAPRNLGPVVNSIDDETDPAFAPNGSVLFAARRGPHFDLYLAEADDAAWREPVPLHGVNSDASERAPAVASDGRTLYYASDRASGAGGFDLYRTVLFRDTWLPSSALTALNTAGDDTDPAPSAEGFTLFFARDGDLLSAGSRELFAWPAAETSGLSRVGSVIVIMLILLMVIYLARRWAEMGILGRSVVASLIAHLILFLYMNEVMVHGTPFERARSEQRFRVTMAAPRDEVPPGERSFEQARGDELAALDAAAMPEARREFAEDAAERPDAQALVRTDDAARDVDPDARTTDRELQRAASKVAVASTRAPAAPERRRREKLVRDERNARSIEANAAREATRRIRHTATARADTTVAAREASLTAPHPVAAAAAKPAGAPAERTAAFVRADVAEPNEPVAVPAAVARTPRPTLAEATPEKPRESTDVDPTAAARSTRRVPAAASARASVADSATEQTLARGATVRDTPEPTARTPRVARADARDVPVALDTPAGPTRTARARVARSKADAKVIAPSVARSPARVARDATPVGAGADVPTRALLDGRKIANAPTVAASRDAREPVRTDPKVAPPRLSTPVAVGRVTRPALAAVGPRRPTSTATALSPGRASELERAISSTPGRSAERARPVASSRVSTPAPDAVPTAVASARTVLAPSASAPMPRLRTPDAPRAPTTPRVAAAPRPTRAPAPTSAPATAHRATPRSIDAPPLDRARVRPTPLPSLIASRREPIAARSLARPPVPERLVARAAPTRRPPVPLAKPALPDRTDSPIAANRVARRAPDATPLRSREAPRLVRRAPLGDPLDVTDAQPTVPRRSASEVRPGLPAPPIRGVSPRRERRPEFALSRPPLVARVDPALRERRNPPPAALAARVPQPVAVSARDLPRMMRGRAAATSTRPASSRRTLAAAARRPSGRLRDYRRTSPIGTIARAPGLFDRRAGDAKLRAVREYGGSEASENAVRNGLAYLARVQRPNGSWGNPRYHHHKYERVNVGKTALCLLAFLGSGHTVQSKTRYSTATARAIRFLIDQQNERGHIGRGAAYGHGIATYALAEAYAMTKDPVLRQPLTRAVNRILDAQNLDRDRIATYGGWSYYYAGDRIWDQWPRASVTAWQVMALKSARIGGVAVPGEAIAAARSYLRNSFDRRSGYFRYNHDPDRLRSAFRTLPGSTPASMFALLILGEDPKSERIQRSLRFVMDRIPTAYARANDHEFVLHAKGNLYFWYYSTLALFTLRNEQWTKWNDHLRDLLVAAQQADGSWVPISSYADYANDTRRDRSYTTALNVLMLEVYYRYVTPLLTYRPERAAPESPDEIRSPAMEGAFRVRLVEEGSVAARGGVRVGDRLHRYAGEVVTDLETLRTLIRRHERAGTVLLEVVRRGEVVRLRVEGGLLGVSVEDR